MVMKQWQKMLAPLCLSVLLFTAACGSSPPPSPYDQVQQETSGSQAPAVADDAVQGGSFNALFPSAADGFDVVPSQEKQGFAEYKLKQDGTTMAMLSINDTNSNPDARTKFANSDRSIAGYPAVDVGSKQTAILVGDRFQVKVQSRDDSFVVGDREAWLERFDLRGLESLLSQSMLLPDRYAQATPSTHPNPINPILVPALMS